jgi:hypothetical protein
MLGCHFWPNISAQELSLLRIHFAESHGAFDHADEHEGGAGEWAGDYGGVHWAGEDDRDWEGAGIAGHSLGELGTPQPPPLKLDMMEMPAQAAKGQVFMFHELSLALKHLLTRAGLLHVGSHSSLCMPHTPKVY